MVHDDKGRRGTYVVQKKRSREVQRWPEIFQSPECLPSHKHQLDVRIFLSTKEFQVKMHVVIRDSQLEVVQKARSGVKTVKRDVEGDTKYGTKVRREREKEME